ncbi:MAG TPA: hypothetical protein DCK95_05480 [Anaerolineaceae bacterium]|nr:hypothetical protein [Anaerolineaceae bacterium]
MNDTIYALARTALALYPYLYALAVIVGVVFTVSGFTDIIFDIYFIFRSVRRFFLSKNWPKLTLERLEAREQQKIALIIACWHEEAVIAKTLTNACESIHYRNYDIFIGTYPNDPDTQREVDKVAKIYPQVHKVVTADDGPTNKASNLNQVFEAIEDYERKTGLQYEIIIMHDSEDVIHPYEFLVSNYLIPRMDLVQVPVFPMAVPSKHWTHWTYADEFAENHTKLLLVREYIGGFVPSAGVGTSFTKRAFELFALENEKKIFTPGSLTEDYELGLRMNLRGYKAAFVLIHLPPESDGKKRKRLVSDWVATRAFFPLEFKRAVRQKTRWNIGIVLQSWQNIGWAGNATIRWNLFQDRKALFTTPANFFGYFVFAYFIFYQILRAYFAEYMPPLIVKGTFLWYLTVISTFFMIWRSINRAYAVAKIYGLWASILSIPRSIWGNVINFFALSRAIIQYATSRLRKQQMHWDKTDHEFPSEVIEEERTSQDLRSNMFESETQKTEIDRDTIVKDFNQVMETGNITEKVTAIKKIDRATGSILFTYLVKYYNDPDWQVRGEFCRTCSYLRYAQAIPYLHELASDSDWTVRSNAVRALGKMGEIGEVELLDILRGDDHYASEAAQVILEHQAFFKQNVRRLLSSDKQEIKRGLSFLEDLRSYGKSKLAEQLLNLYREGNVKEIQVFLGD